MRILFVADEPLVPTNSGGRAETRSEIELLRAQGHEVDVVVCAADDVSADVLELQRDVLGSVEIVRMRSVLSATLRHSTYPLFCSRRMPDASVVDRLATSVRARGPVDVVIAAHEYTLPLAAALGDRLGGRLVLRSHNDEAAYFRGLAASARTVRRVQYALDAWRLTRRLPRLVRPLDVIALISAEDADGYPPAMHERVVVVPPVLAGPTTGGRPTFDARDARLTFVGSLDVGYALAGISWFLSRVWPEVRESRPDAVLELVGRGVGASLHELTAGAPGVVVTGEVPDILPVLDRARVFINPVFDGSGVNMKIGPPLSSGLPVVTTPVGVRGLTALSRAVAVASTSADFARACCDLLSDRDRWTAAAEAGRIALETTYSQAAVARSWESALAAATSERVTR